MAIISLLELVNFYFLLMQKRITPKVVIFIDSSWRHDLWMQRKPKVKD